MYGKIILSIQKLKAFDPWDVMMWCMTALVAYGAFRFGIDKTVPTALFIVGIGILCDYALHGLQKTGSYEFPRSGLITSFIVVMLMPPTNDFRNLVVSTAAILFAIFSKHFIRFRGEHIFNPASFGGAIAAVFLGVNLGWWGDGYPQLVIVLGILNAWRARKLLQVASFAAGYVALLAVLGGMRLPSFNLLLFSIPWFFALYMVPEPITSLSLRDRQIAFGLIVAAGSILFGSVPIINKAPLLFAVMFANVLRFFPPLAPSKVLKN